MQKHIILVASLFLLAVGSGTLWVGQERIAVAAQLLPLDAELDPSALLGADSVIAPADADLFVSDEELSLADEMPAGADDLSSVALPAFEQALWLSVPDGRLGAPPALPADAPGWPRTTAETTLAGPVSRPPSWGHWVDVNLSRQTVTAYNGSTPVKTVLTSTGTRRHPTVTGTFRVWARVKSQTMSGGSRRYGDYYRLPGVPNIQYFFRGYALHGTYWHRNFGRRMSHGCVNLTLDDAAFFYAWGFIGMPVRSHY